jgi:hypothetical protein
MQGGVINSTVFLFSVSDISLASKLNNALGKNIKVHYVQYRKCLPWRGENYNVKNNEKPLLEEKRKRDFLKNKLNKISVKSEIESLSESKIQSEKALSILENYKNAKFIGKTNKENLIFVIEGKQYKVTPRGRIL